MALSFGVIAEPANASRVHFTVTENVIVEEYPQYYVSHRIKKKRRHRCPHCHQCHHRVHQGPRHRIVRYYYVPDYYYYVPYHEVVMYQQEYHWNW